jgi:hypothetical protein
MAAARAEIRRSWRRACADNADHPEAAELFNPEKLPGFHDPFAGGGADQQGEDRDPTQVCGAPAGEPGELPQVGCADVEVPLASTFMLSTKAGKPKDPEATIFSSTVGPSKVLRTGIGTRP